MTDSRLTVVIPALNEGEALPRLLDELLEVSSPRGWKVIVVDDGSTDDTAEVAESKGVRVLRHKVRRGYGGAIKTGIRATDTPFVVTIDADGQHVPADLEGLFAAALDADADLVVGHRQSGSGLYRSLGKWLIRWVSRVLMPHAVVDLNTGLKLFRTELIQRALPLCPDSMAFCDVSTLVFLSNSHLVIERPIQVRPRSGGLSKVSIQTAVETVGEILNIITLFNPMRIFVPLALGAWVAGLAWGIPIVLAGRGVSVGSMLAIVTGVILFAIGLLAEQLAAIRKRQAEGYPL